MAFLNPAIPNPNETLSLSQSQPVRGILYDGDDMTTTTVQTLQRTGKVIGAARVQPGQFIDVMRLSTKPELGTVSCCVQERSQYGWLVSHYGSGLMPVEWCFSLNSWIFVLRGI